MDATDVRHESKTGGAWKATSKRITYYRRLYEHPKTPRLARVLLWLTIAYTLLPFDLIPDFIPVAGHLDDLVIVPALILMALKLVPAEVREECRAMVAEADVSH